MTPVYSACQYTPFVIRKTCYYVPLQHFEVLLKHLMKIIIERLIALKKINLIFSSVSKTGNKMNNPHYRTNLLPALIQGDIF